MPSGVQLWPVVREDIVEPRLVSAVQLAAVHAAAALAWEADAAGYEIAREAAEMGDGWPERARSIALQSKTDARWAAALRAAEHEQAAWLREIFEADPPC